MGHISRKRRDYSSHVASVSHHYLNEFNSAIFNHIPQHPKNRLVNNGILCYNPFLKKKLWDLKAIPLNIR